MSQLYNKSVTSVLQFFKPTLYFLHIGKTGGTSIIESGIGQPQLTNQESYTFKDKLGWKYEVQAVPHWRVPKTFSTQNNLAFFIRNPLSRLESIFFYRKNYLQSDYVIAQSEEINTLFEHFEFFETWFHALQAVENPLHRASLELFTQIKHFQRGYSFYFKDKENVLKTRDRIIFIGEQEKFDEDKNQLLDIIGIKQNQDKTRHRNKSNRPNASKAHSVIQESEARALFPKEYEIYDALVQLKKELQSH